jgi:hypothetical protein
MDAHSDSESGAAPELSDFNTVPGLAKALKCGPRSVYQAIRSGDLRAAPINDRGDLRIAKAWALDWVARRSGKVHAG